MPSSDYARFGLLFLHHGNWLGNKFSKMGYTHNPGKGSGDQYKAFFGSTGGKISRFRWICLAATGNGRFIFIVLNFNSKRISPKGTFDYAAMLKNICDAIE